MKITTTVLLLTLTSIISTGCIAPRQERPPIHIVINNDGGTSSSRSTADPSQVYRTQRTWGPETGQPVSAYYEQVPEIAQARYNQPIGGYQQIPQGYPPQNVQYLSPNYGNGMVQGGNNMFLHKPVSGRQNVYTISSPYGHGWGNIRVNPQPVHPAVQAINAVNQQRAADAYDKAAWGAYNRIAR